MESSFKKKLYDPFYRKYLVLQKITGINDLEFLELPTLEEFIGAERYSKTYADLYMQFCEELVQTIGKEVLEKNLAVEIEKGCYETPLHFKLSNKNYKEVGELITRYKRVELGKYYGHKGWSILNLSINYKGKVLEKVLEEEDYEVTKALTVLKDLRRLLPKICNQAAGKN